MYCIWEPIFPQAFSEHKLFPLYTTRNHLNSQKLNWKWGECEEFKAKEWRIEAQGARTLIPLWATQCPPLVSHTSCIQSSDNTTRDKFIYYSGVHCAIPFWNINDQCNIRSAEVDAFQSIDSFQCSTNTLTSWKIWYKIMQHSSVECRLQSEWLRAIQLKSLL